MQGGQSPLLAESGLWRFVLNHGSTKIIGLNERVSDASWIDGLLAFHQANLDNGRNIF